MTQLQKQRGGGRSSVIKLFELCLRVFPKHLVNKLSLPVMEACTLRGANGDSRGFSVYMSLGLFEEA